MHQHHQGKTPGTFGNPQCPCNGRRPAIGVAFEELLIGDSECLDRNRLYASSRNIRCNIRCIHWLSDAHQKPSKSDQSHKIHRTLPSAVCKGSAFLSSASVAGGFIRNVVEDGRCCAWEASGHIGAARCRAAPDRGLIGLIPGPRPPVVHRSRIGCRLAAMGQKPALPHRNMGVCFDPQQRTLSIVFSVAP